MASLISPRSLAPSLSLFFLFSFAQEGKEVYLKYCADCHGENRLGKTAPPLIPSFLENRTDQEIARIVKEGIPASNMPPFNLKERSLKALITFLRSPLPPFEFEPHLTKINRKPADYGPLSPKDLVVFVDKGRNRIVLLKGSRPVDSFEFRGVHGGVKFTKEGFYVPSRDGWVLHYSLKEKRPVAKLRACLYLRNIAVSGDRVAISCVLPKALFITDRSLNLLKVIPLRGRPSAVYPYREGFILTFRDRPEVAFVDRKGSIGYFKVDTPIQDFFLDPFESYLVGSSKERGGLFVYSLPDLKRVAFLKTESLPHLFAVAFWYKDGSFLFATRHTNKAKVTIWEMYSWKKVAEVDVGEEGFFVRTHPSTPYLWVDGGAGELILIDKETYRVRRVRVSESGTITHVEFSGDGKLAYVSVKGEGLLLLDTALFGKVTLLETPLPSGKYNPLLKTRRGIASLLGFEVFMRKCWGCHHPTRQAFGPPLRWIAERRSRDLIVSQILNPQGTYKLLGYRRNAMPPIKMSPEEMKAILSFMEALKDGWFD